MSREPSLALVDAPYIYHPRTTASLIWGVSATLAPALAWAIFCFGLAAAIPVAVAIVSALAGEAAVGAVRGRFTLWDGSAFLTGLLIGMAMPAGIPPFAPAAASLFAIVLVKGVFGGLGSNWMNPAMAGTVFAFINWPHEMGEWISPRHIVAADGLSGASPLGYVRDAAAYSPAGSSPLDLLQAAGMRLTETDRAVTEALNFSIFGRLGAELPAGYIDLALGNRPGAIGELSGLLILAASIVLISRRMIRHEVPASMIISFALLSWLFGGLPFGKGFFSGDVLFSLFSGSFLLVAFFMAPDPVTSPSTKWGMIIYGAGIGALTFLIRAFGSGSEGSAYAVLVMNCAVPVLSKLGSGRPRSVGEAS